MLVRLGKTDLGDGFQVSYDAYLTYATYGLYNV